MPIKPENKRLYPANWQAIRRTILQRANDRCEWCGVPNHEIVERNDAYADGWRVVGALEAEAMALEGYKTVYIILTIAHLDHDPAHNTPDNLRALCQRCHNRYDQPHRQANARRTRARKAGQRELEL